MAQVISPQIGQKDDALSDVLKGVQITDSVYGMMAKRAGVASGASGLSAASADMSPMQRRLNSTSPSGQ